MALGPLKVAVVGHTNTGKTSLLRTLTRDRSFGEVSDRPATTRHVEGTAILLGGRAVMELYDTPGLEDSLGLRERLEEGEGMARGFGVDRIREFLAGPEAHGQFTQEAKALRQLLASDVALYVIDVRDRILGKHRDELDVLHHCARPIVPVLNFVQSREAQTATWRDHLARLGLHAVAEFDTVVFDEIDERRLLEKMRTLLDDHREMLDELIAERSRQRKDLVRGSAALIAEMLIDAAAHVVLVPAAHEAEARAALERLKQQLRDRERACVAALLELHRFGRGDCDDEQLPVVEGHWGLDLFSPAAMKQVSVAAGAGAAVGAAAGLVIDVMTAGLSLGAAAALGATIGAAVGGAGRHGRRLLHRARGQIELRCDEATLQLLAARQLALTRALLCRGHASQQPIRIGRAQARGPITQLLRRLEPARVETAWSTMSGRNDYGPQADFRRDALLKDLARGLADLMIEDR